MAVNAAPRYAPLSVKKMRRELTCLGQGLGLGLGLGLGPILSPNRIPEPYPL